MGAAPSNLAKSNLLGLLFRRNADLQEQAVPTSRILQPARRLEEPGSKGKKYEFDRRQIRHSNGKGTINCKILDRCSVLPGPRLRSVH